MAEFTSNQAFTMGDVLSSLSPRLRNNESQLKSTMTTMGSSGDVSAMDMISLQKKLNDWNILSNLASTITKELGDTVKSVIQKAG